MRAYNYYQFNSEDRFYHNYQHAKNVMASCAVITEIPSESLILAALWHDAVYIPAARNGVNENASAAALTHDFNRGITVCSIPVLHHATRLIEHTTVENHFSTDLYGIPELDVLLDADLSSLAYDYTEFETAQYNILRENHFDPIVKHSRARTCNFLEALASTRKHIYRTDKARELYEEQAHYNINRFIKENRV
jgi:predicted metal-dependent HD superfamily phosphohydrolase